MNLENTDFIDDLGVLALGSRLKRISDRLISDASRIYELSGIEVEPRWFPILALLENQNEINIGSASRKLGISQPAVSQFVRELERAKLITIKADQQDARRRNFSLTKEGHKRLAQMKRIWPSVRAAAQQLCDETAKDFYTNIVKLEKNLQRNSLTERAHENMKINQARLLEYSPQYKAHFQEITREWVSSMFVLEDSDLAIIENPEKKIIEPGGHILFAELPDLGIVGTCALMKDKNDEYELTKMGVLQKARGRGVGEFLMKKVIEKARAIEAKKIYLLSNRKCETAIYLYKKYGFRDDGEIAKKFAEKYERCDITMSLKL